MIVTTLGMQMYYQIILIMIKIKNKRIKTKEKKVKFYGLGKLNYLIFRFLCSRFRM